MPRPSNTETRKLQIIRAMSRVMAQQGYDGATVKSIAREAGLTAGLIHYHFGSKLEILLALMSTIADNLESRFQARDAGPAIERLNALIDAHLSLDENADEEAVACWVAVGSEALRDAAILEAYQAISSRQIMLLEDLIEQALRQQKRSQASKRAIALGVYSAIEGAYRLIVSAPAFIERGFAAKTVRMMAAGAIESQPSM